MTYEPGSAFTECPNDAQLAYDLKFAMGNVLAGMKESAFSVKVNGVWLLVGVEKSLVQERPPQRSATCNHAKPARRFIG